MRKQTKRAIKPAAAGQPKKTDAENLGLIGAVRQVMEVRYRAHQRAGAIIPGKIEDASWYERYNFITTFNEQGAKIHELVFGTDGSHATIYNEAGQQVESIHCKKDGNLYQTHVHTYNKWGGLVENVVRNADGSLYYRTFDTYRDDGKPLEHVHYMGDEERIISRRVNEYDAKGNQISSIHYKAGDKIESRTHMKYDERGLRTEYTIEYTDPKMAASYQKQTSRYNEQGDCIELNFYNKDGSLKSSHSYTYEYDSEGKRIITPRPAYDPYAKKEGETEQCTSDAHGNWIKKTTFYNKIPVSIFIREIVYFGEPDKKLSHPLSDPLIYATETEDTDNVPEKLTDDQAKWLADSPSITPEGFSNLRYYVMRYKDVPSVVSYTGPNIEVLALMNMLKENMKAQEIHSYASVWNGNRERMQRYTLIFPRHYGYMLHAPGIGAQDADEFVIPGNMERHVDGYVYTCAMQLLRPSAASRRRDRYFEEELNEYIALCSLRKKPDKPVINMIEVRNNAFEMVEHAVADNFEIKDLDVNYGYGFQKFHTDLMHRFNSSTKGLVLFHGEPGTGKTFYIRHLLRKMASNKKVVIYMPPNMVDHLVEPGFMTFLTSKVQHWSSQGNFCVLLIEDAEPLLAKRQEGVRIQGVTNLLNMTDGLLNDMLNLQIICTFNVDLRRLDSALLRPGRLIARKEFKALSELDANLLAQRLGIKHHFKAPASLGEIYAMLKNKNTLIHDVEPDKDASTNLDDLV